MSSNQRDFALENLYDPFILPFAAVTTTGQKLGNELWYSKSGGASNYVSCSSGVLTIEHINTGFYTECKYMSNAYGGAGKLRFVAGQHRAEVEIKTSGMSGASTTGIGCNVISSKEDGTVLSNNSLVADGVLNSNTDWTRFTLDFTPAANAMFLTPNFLFYGHQGAATLIGKAEFRNFKVYRL